MRVKTMIIFLSVYFLFESLSAQRLPFKTYTIEDGLAQSVVYKVFQDSKGYLWFGTQGGVSKFDGTTFVNYTEEDGLISDYISSITEDRQGNIWLGSHDGGISVLKKDGIINYTPAQGLVNGRVFSIIIDIQDRVWIGTMGGVSCLENEEFTNYTTEDGLPDNRIRSIMEGRDRNIWFGTRSGVSRFSNGKLENLATEYSLPNNDIFAITEDKEGNIWFGTEDRGVICLKKNGKLINLTTEHGLSHNRVYSITEDNEGNMWFGTLEGISRFKDNEYVKIYNTKHGLVHNRIYSIIQDIEDNMWFGTHGGVNCLIDEKFENYTTDQGLAHNLVYAITEDSKENIWVGTYGGGVSCLSGNEIKNYTTDDGLAHNIVYSIKEDSKGNIWFGTLGGASKLENGKFVNYTTNQGLPHNRVWKVEEDSKGNIWFGTYIGVSRLREGRFNNYGIDDGLPDLSCRTIFEDSKGNVWIGTYNGGLSRFNNGKFYKYTVEDGLASNRVYSILEDIKGNMWFGTRKGISCFRDGEFTNLTTSDGLSDNTCFFILEDDEDYLWIGTNKGVNKFDGKTFKMYGKKDGIASDEMNQGAGFKDSQGALWFGSVGGMTKFYPELDSPNLVPPPVYITRFRIFEQEMIHGQRLVLKYNQNYLKFDYAGLCYTAPEEVIYRYKLDGLDKDWQTSSLRTVQYTSLADGRYTFRVTARNNDGVWSEKPAEFSFIITPPFWRTWWFRIVLVIVVASAVFGWYEYRINNIRKQRKALEVQVTERTKELRELNATKDTFFSIIAHDLKSSLQVQLSGSRLLADRIKNINKKTIETIGEELKKNTENLFTLLENLLQWSRIQTGRMEHQPAEVSLLGLVDECTSLLMGDARNKGIKLVPKIDEDVVVYADRNMIRSVVQNILSNAVKFTERGGKVEIQCIRMNGNVEVSITDTGVGMEESQLKKLFRIDEHYTTMGTADEKGSGLGLILCKEFVEKNGGMIQIESKIDEGTRVIFTLPAI